MLKINSENDKNLVLFYLADNSGCSHVRCRFFADYINANDFGIKAVILPVPTLDPIILSKTRAVIWQKPATYNHLTVIQKYKGFQKKFGFKLIYELDDLFFTSPIRGECLPPYNISYQRRKDLNLNEEIEDALHQIIPLFDTVMCSTDYLKKVVIQKYNFDNVVTVKNTVPRFLWACDRRKPIEKDIEKPLVLYSGASGHYRNPKGEGDPGDFGDWNCAFREWIIKNVTDDKINFKIMGDFPWFFKPIAPKIQFIPWTNSYNYPRRCWSSKADFQIAPLAENEFNMGKSALRFYESSIAGMGFFGSVFDTSSDSPYEEIYPECKIKNSDSIEELDQKFWNMCKRDNFNDMIRWQYDNLDKSGLILESTDAINRLLSVIDRNTSLLESI